MGTRTAVGDELAGPGAPEDVEAKPPTPPIPPIPPCEDDGMLVGTDVPMSLEETTITVLETRAPDETDVETKSEFAEVGVAPDNEANVVADDPPAVESEREACGEAEIVVAGAREMDVPWALVPPRPPPPTMMPAELELEPGTAETEASEEIEDEPD